MSAPRGMSRTLLLVVCALLVVVGGFAWRALTPTAQPAYMTALVTRGDVEETVLATGILKPVRLVAVGSQASGRIISVKVELGQRVAAGDLVAEIDSVTQENSLRTAEAALANVRAQRQEKLATLVLNDATLARQRSMVAQKAVSQADYESAQAAVDVTRAQIEALEAQIVEAEVSVATARANLGYTRITAPIDGTVLAIVSQEGQTVNAVQSAPTIVILGQLDTMTVRTEIAEADVVKVKPGLPVFFTILGDPGHRYEAKLKFIEPAPESIRSDSSFSTSTTSTATSSSSSSEAIYYNGVFDVPNPDDKLRTYMTAEVHIVLDRAEGVLTVPSAALGVSDGEGRYMVRVVEPGGALVDREVEIGLNDKVVAEVRSGLAEGERVVTGEGLAAGTAATPRRPGPPMGL